MLEDIAVVLMSVPPKVGFQQEMSRMKQSPTIKWEEYWLGFLRRATEQADR